MVHEQFSITLLLQNRDGYYIFCLTVATLSPQIAPTTSAAGAPESSAAGGNVVAPAAAPANSASFMLFSSVTLFLGLSVASLPYF